MTFQHDADGVPREGTQSDDEVSESGDNGDTGRSEDTENIKHVELAENTGLTENSGATDDGAAVADAVDSPADAGDPPQSPQHSRALLALVAAGTLAVAPIAGTVLGPAGGGDGAHSSPVFVLAELSHDIGHNDWAFQGGLDERFIWVATYLAIALAWLGVTLWMRTRDRRAAKAAASPSSKLWLKTLGIALAAEFAAGLLTIGAGLYAQWTATDLGPVVLRLADVCSPWWSCVAVLILVARAERNTVALRAALAYGVVLVLVLLVPVPGPSDLKAVILAATAAIPALQVSPTLIRRSRSGAAAVG